MIERSDVTVDAAGSAVNRRNQQLERIDPVPLLGVRWMVGVAVAVPLLLAAGVYWLHRLPASGMMSASHAIVEVRLITPQSPDEIRQAAAVPPSPSTAASQSQPPVQDTHQDRHERPEAMRHAMLEQPPAQSPSESSSVSSPMPTSAQRSASAVRGLPSETALAFQRALLAHIARYRHYPVEAKRDKLRGIVQLVFAMGRDGTVMDVWLQKSSGSAALDAAAMETIWQAQPLPRIPSDLPDRLRVSIPVAYDIP